MVNTCVKYHQYTSKEIELSYRNSYKFKIRIWLWPSEPKVNRGPPWVLVNTCVKYHLFMTRGKRVIMQNPLLHRQTWWNQYTPPLKFVGRGITILVKVKAKVIHWTLLLNLVNTPVVFSELGHLCWELVLALALACPKSPSACGFVACLPVRLLFKSLKHNAFYPV